MNSPRDFDPNAYFHLSHNQDKINFILQYGILAPSTHNTQPWLFDISDRYCEISLNQAKELSFADNKKRNMLISIGCCVENIILVSRYFNIFDSMEILKGPPIVVRIFFNFSNEKTNFNLKHFLNTIQTRQNIRGAFNCLPVSSDVIMQLEKVGLEYKDVGLRIITDQQQMQIVERLTIEGALIASSNPGFRQEMSHWIINNHSKRKEGMPGYSLNVPYPISLILPFLIRRLNLGRITSRLIRKNFSSAKIVVVVTTKGRSAEELIQVGRLSERLMLELQSQKIQTSIAVASVEVDDIRQRLKDKLLISEEPQFIFTAGFTDKIRKFTPRFSVDEKMQQHGL